MRAALARRGNPELLEQLDQVARARRAARARSSPGATRSGPRSTSSRSRSARCAAAGDVAAAEEVQARSRGARRGRARRSPPSTTALQAAAPRPAAAHPQPAAADAPDGAGEADNPVVKGPVGLLAEYPEHQRVPHWETAAALGILDNERAAQDQRRDVHDAARAGRHAGAGAVPVRARPQRRRVRGDPPAVAGHHRDAHRHRPAAEVRRRRLRDRARRPVVHPHRRGAAHVDLRGRDARRGRSCRCG